jgi:hypothetical protein
MGMAAPIYFTAEMVRALPTTATATRPCTGSFESLRAYVRPYGVVDGETSQVEVLTPDVAFPRIERERVVWHPASARQPFTLDLPELFHPI